MYELQICLEFLIARVFVITFYRDGRECVDTHVIPEEDFSVDVQPGETHLTPDYLCGISFGTLACNASVYETTLFDICEMLLCVDPSEADVCVEAGFIPPHGKYLEYCLSQLLWYLVDNIFPDALPLLRNYRLYKKGNLATFIFICL